MQEKAPNLGGDLKPDIELGETDSTGEEYLPVVVVEDIAQAIEELEYAGGTITKEPEQIDRTPYIRAEGFDVLGRFVMLIQPPPE
jgi:predicted enzyme related to lactoylglutathione lyase